LYTITLENLKQLIEGCRKQEPRYQKLLYERYYGYALKISFRYIYRYDTATNVVNDAFVKLFRHFDKFRNDDDALLERMLMGWIRRIVINTAIDELRKNNMTPEIGGIPEQVWEEADNSRQADQLLLYKELITYVKHLPPTYRIVFNMFVIDGCSHFEIADTLGISVGTSKSNLSRARVFLQKLIKSKEEIKTWNI
jgi:RNA polymerase sigma-70 factor (ECF subfamily)